MSLCSLPPHAAGPDRELYDAERVHTRVEDSPEGRPTEAELSPTPRVVALPRVGPLHQRYTWAKAA